MGLSFRASRVLFPFSFFPHSNTMIYFVDDLMDIYCDVFLAFFSLWSSFYATFGDVKIVGFGAVFFCYRCIYRHILSFLISCFLAALGGPFTAWLSIFLGGARQHTYIKAFVY